MSKRTVVAAASIEDADQLLQLWIARGYTVLNRAPATTTLIKHKEFSTLWAVIGIVLCVLPLLLYLIVYASQRDHIVEIRISAATDQAQPSVNRRGS